MLIRAKLQESGTVSVQQVNVNVLQTRSDITEADKQWAARYRPGDVVVYQNKAKSYGIAKDDAARVLSVDSVQRRVTVQFNDGRKLEYDPRRLHGVSLYEERQALFSVGDKVQFTANNREYGTINRQIGVIESLDPVTLEMKVRLSSEKETGGQLIEFNAKDFKMFDHGYVSTSHSSQCMTVKYVCVNADTELNKKLLDTRFAYVSISRGAQDVTVFTNDKSELGKVLENQVTKESAIDATKYREVQQIDNTIDDNENRKSPGRPEELGNDAVLNAANNSSTANSRAAANTSENTLTQEDAEYDMEIDFE